jgi:hypothetical protein
MSEESKVNNDVLLPSLPLSSSSASPYIHRPNTPPKKAAPLDESESDSDSDDGDEDDENEDYEYEQEEQQQQQEQQQEQEQEKRNITSITSTLSPNKSNKTKGHMDKQIKKLIGRLSSKIQFLVHENALSRSVCLSVCLSALSVCLSVCLFGCLS